MKRIAILSFFALSILALGANAQEPGSGMASGGEPSATSGGRKKIGPGDKIEDENGTVVKNEDTDGNNTGVNVEYEGKAKQVPPKSGCWEVDGTITTVTNPKSNGSDGKIIVQTNGNDVDVNLKKTGPNATNRLETEITGGGATVNVSGNNNTVSVGGANNQVTMTGSSNTGNGTTGSSGNVSLQGRNNSWGGTGNWTVSRPDLRPPHADGEPGPSEPGAVNSRAHTAAITP